MYNELLSLSGKPSLQVKLVAIGYMSAGAGSTTANVRLTEYFTGNVYGTWSQTFVNATDNITIETPWTPISSPGGAHHGFRFEMNNSAGRAFTLYNVSLYIRPQ